MNATAVLFAQQPSAPPAVAPARGVALGAVRRRPALRLVSAPEVEPLAPLLAFVSGVSGPATRSIVPAVSAPPKDREVEREEERLLCARAQGGDKAALGQLLRRHGPTLYRTVLLPRLGGEAAAQDALADTYVRVMERFAQFEWRGCGVYPWLRVIAMRIALDMLRARRRESLFEPADLSRAVDDAERDLDQGLDAELCERRDLEASRQRLDKALATINQRYALAIRLRILEERSREAAAEALGVSVPTFDVVLHRALAALKRAISEAA
ncbi:MAG: sigma-70 family RNA polymerase sigma factor [Polyangiaceae bacterium]|nr:sigma-70 family RNA polymerase sigma factor [Polyangiaceae bacterium]